MRSDLVLQPFADDQGLLEVLQSGLADLAYESLTVVVAWARQSGLRHITEGIESFRARGGTAEVIVGIDEGGATVEGLDMALATFDSALVVHDPSGGTFHPKIYLLRGPHEALLIVGSNNLTAGGLYFNYEAAHLSTLDLGLAPDLQTLETLEDYIRRIKQDDTCVPLSPDLIQALAVEPRYRVGWERDHRTTDGDTRSDSASERPESIFGTTRYLRKTIVSGPPIARQGPIDYAWGGVHRYTQESGGSTAPAVARWTKRLTRSDSGQPRPGSQTTAALRFTKAGHPINQASWFRTVLFSAAEWLEDPTRPGRQRASLRFEVEFEGRPLGTHVLALKYDAEREADQNNFTTDLKWGSLTPALTATSLVDSYVIIERLADDTYRMSVVPSDPPPFVDSLSL